MRFGGRTLRADRLGLSEIVGALMLVLIVVVAATAFSVFVENYQKQLQAEQAINHERAIEALTTLSIQPTMNATVATNFFVLNLTLSSLTVEASIVTSISINDNTVHNYTVWTVDPVTGAESSQTVLPGGVLNLAAHEVANVVVCFNSVNTAMSSFFNTGFVLPATSFVKVQLFTQLLNDFTTVFLPPTAIATVAVNIAPNGSGGFTEFPILDGSHSSQHGGNASLTSWTWVVTPSGGSPTMVSGEEASAPFTSAAGTVYAISLTVTNSDGLLGLSTISYKF